MDNQLLKDLAELKSKYTESGSQRQIDGWERQAKDALMIDSLKDHKGVRIIIEAFESDILAMNNILHYSSALTETERNRILDKREMREKFLTFFRDAKSTINNIEKNVQEQKE